MKDFLQICLFYGLFLSVWCHYDMLQVTIRQGKLKGTYLTTRNGSAFRAFLGIPYARPPIDELRFAPTQTADPWFGIRDASIPPPRCLQRMGNETMATRSTVVGDEDCLYLNVYTPLKINFLQKLPVMVYIHGGDFMQGSANDLSPSYFLDEEIVLVTFNYRLGVLGFLSAMDIFLPGNYGMKDQVAALTWVQHNIKAFHGDSDQVTIFGHDAGAASVQFHMHSPLSAGLFHRAISQSGSALAFSSLSHERVGRAKAFGFGILAGCPIETTIEMLECLLGISAEELVTIQDKFLVRDTLPAVLFPVVVDAYVSTAFLPKSPWKHTPVNAVPWITGITSSEGGLKASRWAANDGHLMKEIEDLDYRIFPLLFSYVHWLTYEESLRVSEEIKEYYFKDQRIDFNTLQSLINMLTDGNFLYPCVESVRRHTDVVYLYYYDHKNEISFSNVSGKALHDFGVSHMDDLISFFGIPILRKDIRKGYDLFVSRRMMKYWINFVQTGNPSTKQTEWPISNKYFRFLHIKSTEDVTKERLRWGRYTFWRDILTETSYYTKKFSIKTEL